MVIKIVITKNDIHHMIDRCYDHNDRKQRLECLKNVFESLLHIVDRQLKEMEKGDGYGG